MPNELFIAKRLWEAGDRRGGDARFEAALARSTEAPPFEDAELLLGGSASEAFEPSVVALLTATLPNSAKTVLRVPFARTLAALWTLDPWQGWIDAPTAYDVSQAPRAEGFDDEPHAPPPNDEHDPDAPFVEGLRDGDLSRVSEVYPSRHAALGTDTNESSSKHG